MTKTWNWNSSLTASQTQTLRSTSLTPATRSAMKKDGQPARKSELPWDRMESRPKQNPLVSRSTTPGLIPLWALFLRYIMAELLQTERVYVRDLQECIEVSVQLQTAGRFYAVRKNVQVDSIHCFNGNIFCRHTCGRWPAAQRMSRPASATKMMSSSGTSRTSTSSTTGRLNDRINVPQIFSSIPCFWFYLMVLLAL